MFFYSKTTGGFYHSAIHSSMPSDAVKITEERYQELIAGQVAGASIVADDTGSPMLLEPTKRAPETIAAENEREWRDQQLATTDHHVLPDAPISTEQRNEIVEYRKALRDWTENERFPDSAFRPEAPLWL